MLLLKVCLQFLVKQSCLLKRVPISLHHTYTDTCWPWTNAIWFVIWQVPILYILWAHMQSALHKWSCLDPAVFATVFAVLFWSPELPCISLLYPISALLMSIHFNFAKSHLDTACPSSTLLCVVFCFTGWWTNCNTCGSELIMVQNALFALLATLMTVCYHTSWFGCAQCDSV